MTEVGQTGPDEAVDRVFREEWGRVVAALARAFGDLDVAEDAAQEAFAVAARTWPATGVPPNPGGWITTTAKRRAIDRVRRDARRATGHEQVARHDPVLGGAAVDLDGAGGELLDLVLTCCHPALDEPTQVALTLRMVAGLGTRAIARGFMVPESTIAQRLVRASRRLRELGALGGPNGLAEELDLDERLPQVLAVVHLVFNEGYVASGGDGLDRPELVVEALHLGRLLVRALPREPEVRGLLALMLLTEARRPARVGSDGSFVPLVEQDRERWDRTLVDEGHSLVQWCLQTNRPGPFQIQAAIHAVHCDAPTLAATDWGQIVALYDQLLALTPTAVVALNRAVAVAELDGPRVGLALVDPLGGELDRYHLWHAVRGDLLERCGEAEAAADAFERAAELTRNEAERRHLARRRAACLTDGR